MRIAVVGASGLVGGKMLQVLEEKNFPVTELFPVASAKSIGKKSELQRKRVLRDWTRRCGIQITRYRHFFGRWLNLIGMGT